MEQDGFARVRAMVLRRKKTVEKKYTDRKLARSAKSRACGILLRRYWHELCTQAQDELEDAHYRVIVGHICRSAQEIWSSTVLNMHLELDLARRENAC